MPMGIIFKAKTPRFIRLLSKPRFLWIFKNLNPNTYKGLFLVWKEIYYEIHGQGEPVVVLHGGLVGSIGEMGQLIDNLAKTHQVIAVSTRGHGKSEIGHQVPSYAVKAQDVYNVLTHITDKPAHILGFSDGAYTAYHFALNFPDKTAKIIAIGAGEWQKAFAPLVERLPILPNLTPYTGKSKPQSVPNPSGQKNGMGKTWRILMSLTLARASLKTSPPKPCSSWAKTTKTPPCQP